jgi:hypothetical protein
MFKTLAATNCLHEKHRFVVPELNVGAHGRVPGNAGRTAACGESIEPHAQGTPPCAPYAGPTRRGRTLVRHKSGEMR